MVLPTFIFGGAQSPETVNKIIQGCSQHEMTGCNCEALIKNSEQ